MTEPTLSSQLLGLVAIFIVVFILLLLTGKNEKSDEQNVVVIIEKTEDESCEEGCEKLENGMNKYSHHYDEHGNILETRNEIFGGEPFKYVNKYVDGKLVEQTQFAYGGREVTTFDTNGNKIQLFVTAITADGNVNTKFNNIRTAFFFVSPYIKKDKATIGKLPIKRQIVAIIN